jgi:hypothetical protein
MLVLDMIDILPPLGKYKYDTSRILPLNCYIDNSVHLRRCIRNVNSVPFRSEDWNPFLSPRWRSWSQSSALGLRNLDPAMRFSRGFPGLLLGALVNRRFLRAGPSPWSTSTGSDRRAIGGLNARITGWNRDGRDWDITFKSRNGRDKAIQILRSNSRNVRF